MSKLGLASSARVSPRSRRRRRIRVEGTVQGVGFRPFVHGLASRLGLGGRIWNDSRGVIIEAEGEAAALSDFERRIACDAPPLAVIEDIGVEDVAPLGESAFAIVASRAEAGRTAWIAPDMATCPECLAEMLDPADRRYEYAFTNCTNCGPRFTIVRDVPYDRPFTTMSGFAMCAACAREYRDPNDRRFHAEPISCPQCGPRLRLVDRAGGACEGEPIRAAAALLGAGSIVAVKGLGGYHLAAAADDEAAVARLRSRKHREEKPFALLVADLDAARRIAQVDAVEMRLLANPRRPIVLVRRSGEGAVAESVAPQNRFLGLMLPYTPLHHLLSRRIGRPLVLTSGNVSDEPIAYDDEDAARRLSGIADFFLTHDRPIHIRTDDSVARVLGGRTMVMRRSRGYAPEPLLLPRAAARPVLACGAQLKSTFCLARGRHAFVSPHIGDLENFATLGAYRAGIEHFQRLFAIRPEVVAHDLHPDYLSTRHALAIEGVERLGVQHHHAHVAACLAENGEVGPAIGVAFDGLGYGTDGTLWGGELLLADLRGFERVAHLEPVAMPGGEAAIREPWRMAAAHLYAAYGNDIPGELAVVRRNAERWDRVLELVRRGLNAPMTSSIGRLFDAVAALLNVRDAVLYEGQAAIELEQLADAESTSAHAMGFEFGEPLRLRGADLICAVVEDLAAGVPASEIAARFHNGVAAAIASVSAAIRARRGVSLVALSGGVFQNALLLARTVALLERGGFRVLTHARVPANDGGISYGQAAIAAAQRSGAD